MALSCLNGNPYRSECDRYIINSKQSVENGIKRTLERGEPIVTNSLDHRRPTSIYPESKDNMK